MTDDALRYLKSKTRAKISSWHKGVAECGKETNTRLFFFLEPRLTPSPYLPNRVCFFHIYVLRWCFFFLEIVPKHNSWHNQDLHVATSYRHQFLLALYNHYCDFFANFTWRVWGTTRGLSSKSSPLSTTAKKLTTTTKPSKVPLGASVQRQWPLPPSKFGRSLFFFRPSARPPAPNPWFGIYVPPPPWVDTVLPQLRWWSWWFWDGSRKAEAWS
jgi:hypothetical protein